MLVSVQLLDACYARQLRLLPVLQALGSNVAVHSADVISLKSEGGSLTDWWLFGLLWCVMVTHKGSPA